MDESVAVEPQTTWVRVAVDGASAATDGGVLTYAVPHALCGMVAPGQLVWAPVRNRLVHAIVIENGQAEPAFDTRQLGSIVDPPIRLQPWQLRYAEWLARETASSVFRCATLFLPPGRKHRAVEWVIPAETLPDPLPDLTPRQRSTWRLIADTGAQPLDALRKATGQSLTSIVPALTNAGLMRVELRPEDSSPGDRIERFVRLLDGTTAVSERAHRQRDVLDGLRDIARFRRDGASDLVPLRELRIEVDASATTLKALAKKGAIELVDLPKRSVPVDRPEVAPTLSAAQARVWAHIESSLWRGDPTPNLIFGVTGSGKTEIYLRAVAWCLRQGKTAIILVPEIALATQVVRRFVDRFPGLVGIVHSRMTESERHEMWQLVASGEIRVLVGPRSALFAPFERLGVIVIDEEHDASFKQDSEPRYHARTAARRLAEEVGASLILGSATPSVESMWMAEHGRYQLLELPDRIAPSIADVPLELPPVSIVDMKDELRQGHTGLISRDLQAAVQRSLSRGEQSILLLNRRGMSTVVMCRACGHRLECPQCDIPLVFHQDRRQMLCHRCDFRAAPLERCPACDGRLDYFGAGTQRVESEVRRLWSDARILRWDQDAVRQRGGYDVMLRSVEHGEVDIVVGTQMVSKGFDLPLVTTIGVVQADTMLYLPDFRSGERTFQLLTQVAGRAGRRGPGSRVVFQTYTPDHYAIQAASRHDYRQFYADEVAFRQDHRYPPFFRLARFVRRGEREQQLAIEAGLFARDLARHAVQVDAEIELLGPTPAFVAKIRGVYQWQLVMRTGDMERMLDGLPVPPGWSVDIDPESML